MATPPGFAVTLFLRELPTPEDTVLDRARNLRVFDLLRIDVNDGRRGIAVGRGDRLHFGIMEVQRAEGRPQQEYAQGETESPTRLTRKAFMPAAAAAGFWNQKPMSR